MVCYSKIKVIPMPSFNFAFIAMIQKAATPQNRSVFIGTPCVCICIYSHGCIMSYMLCSLCFNTVGWA